MLRQRQKEPIPQLNPLSIQPCIHSLTPARRYWQNMRLGLWHCITWYCPLALYRQQITLCPALFELYLQPCSKCCSVLGLNLWPDQHAKGCFIVAAGATTRQCIAVVLSLARLAKIQYWLLPHILIQRVCLVWGAYPSRTADSLPACAFDTGPWNFAAGLWGPEGLPGQHLPSISTRHNI